MSKPNKSDIYVAKQEALEQSNPPVAQALTKFEYGIMGKYTKVRRPKWCLVRTADSESIPCAKVYVDPIKQPGVYWLEDIEVLKRR